MATKKTPAKAAPAEEAVQPEPRQMTKLELDIRAAAATVAMPEKFDIYSLAPWSYSRYKTLSKCPFQFYLKYLLNVRAEEGDRVQTDPTAALVGKAAHSILELVCSGTSVDDSFETVKSDTLSKNLLSEEEWVEKAESLRYNIRKFESRINTFKQLHPVKEVHVEFPMAITATGKPTSFFAKNAWVRGLIDFMMLLEVGDLIIMDHKTGAVGSVKPYEEQLSWYKIMYHFGVNKIRGSQSSLHFIREGEVKMGSYSSAKEIETNMFNQLEMSLEGAVDKVLGVGYFKHKRGSYCAWCDYNNAGCKDGHLKDVELATKGVVKKWIPITPVSTEQVQRDLPRDKE